MRVIKNLSNLQLQVVNNIGCYIRGVGTRKARQLEYWIVEHEGNQYFITKSARTYTLHDFMVGEKEFMRDFKKIAQHLKPFDLLDLIGEISEIRETLKEVWVNELELGWRV